MHTPLKGKSFPVQKTFLVLREIWGKCLGIQPIFALEHPKFEDGCSS